MSWWTYVYKDIRVHMLTIQWKAGRLWMAVRIQFQTCPTYCDSFHLHSQENYAFHIVLRLIFGVASLSQFFGILPVVAFLMFNYTPWYHPQDLPIGTLNFDSWLWSCLNWHTYEPCYVRFNNLLESWKYTIPIYRYVQLQMTFRWQAN